MKEAIAEIGALYDEACERYGEQVVPGVSDDSVLETERDTLEAVLAILNRQTPAQDVLPVLAFEPEAHDTWIDIVDRFRGYGVTLTLADGEEVEAVLVGQIWDEECADYRIIFHRVIDGEYPAVEDIGPEAKESRVGVRQIRIS
jgi:hypothetical protein